MMLFEALGSALLGSVGAGLAARALVLATGPAGALFGAFVTHTALDPGNVLLILLGAAVVSVASLSLLLRPSGRLRRSATA